MAHNFSFSLKVIVLIQEIKIPAKNTYIWLEIHIFGYIYLDTYIWIHIFGHGWKYFNNHTQQFLSPEKDLFGWFWVTLYLIYK